jgi:hypothetical protein
MTSETNMFEMCGQYLMMSFFSQNAAIIKKRRAAPSLKEPIDDLGHLVLIQDPLFENIKACLSHTSIFPMNTDTSSFVFCVLYQTGDFPDPLLLLPEILKRVTMLERDEATKMWSRIRKLLKWKAINLLSKGLRVEIAETCLSVIGASNEVFGFQTAETQKLRELVQEMMFEPETGSQDMGIPGSHASETSVGDNPFQRSTPPNESSSEALNLRGALDEEGLIALVVAGDVVLDCSHRSLVRSGI